MKNKSKTRAQTVKEYWDNLSEEERLKRNKKVSEATRKAMQRPEIKKKYEKGYKKRKHPGKKISKALKKRYEKIEIWNKDKHLSEEHRKKISENNWMKGRKQSKEFIKKRVKGKEGYKHSEETKNKIKIKALGRKVSKETKAKISATLCRKIKNGEIKAPFKSTKAKRRKDLNNIFFRSSLEANYARYLNLMKIKWEYEPKIFKLSSGKSYLIDWYLPEFGMYVETKGYMWKDDKEKIKLFKKEHSDKYLKVLMQDSEEWKSINKFGEEHIKNWEVRN